MMIQKTVLRIALFGGAFLVGGLLANVASAAMIISEVDAAGSGNAAYGADWFELTNTGSTAVGISGWKMDDNSNSFSSAVALTGVSSIAAGQSVIFIEGNTATLQANFTAAWFGSNVPSGLTFGGYSGSGVSLGQSGDAVNIFNSTGAVVTRVDFGASAAGTFDNTAGLNNVTLTQKSVAGVNGAFNSVTGGEIGSPGVAPVPLPAAAWLLLSGFGMVGPMLRRRQ